MNRVARLFAVMAAFAASASALAQQAPPQPRVTGASPVLGYAVMFVLLLMVLGISLFPSKRSHQD